ncbi:MAG: hypothetical protein PVS2B2_11330 [Candidatus Acidiferrum sp.]
MHFRIYPIAGAALAMLLVWSPSAASANSGHEKTVWNYDGGVFISTEGSIPDGPCFKISIRLTAPVFFDNLKRVDVDDHTIFRRGPEILTHFPEKLDLSFSIRDLPCNLQQQVTAQSYLTPSAVESLRLSFFWKRGTELRPVQHVSRISSKVDRIPPYATELAKALPEKFEWFSEFDVPGAGVPLTDSLVLIFRSADGKIAARVAARL